MRATDQTQVGQDHLAVERNNNNGKMVAAERKIKIAQQKTGSVGKLERIQVSQSLIEDRFDFVEMAQHKRHMF
jgi:hypothetical protein